jgi:hypothetical protein
MGRTLVAQRRYAAEEVCWSLMLVMQLGGMDEIPLEWRKLIADPLMEWCKLCEATGQMKKEPEGEDGGEEEEKEVAVSGSPVI